MNTRQRRQTPEPRAGVWAEQPPFPRRARVRMAIGLAALAPAAVLGALPANIDLGSLDGTNGFTLSGVVAYDNSGVSVSAAGDVNGDGLDDVIIGATGADPNGNYSGASYVVFGGVGVGSSANLELSTLDGTNGFKLSGVVAYDHSGRSVSAAGDVNGDGVDDVIIGAPGRLFHGSHFGASYVVFSKDTAAAGAFPANLELSTLDGTNGFKLSGVAAFDRSGVSVSAAGDVNGDGLDDLLIGAYFASPNGSGSGASYVVFGGAGVGSSANLELSTLDGTNGFKLSGVAFYDQSGRSVSAAGDVNGDGVDDLLIGAPSAPNRSYSGASYVVFGKDTATAGAFPANLGLSTLDGTNGFKLSGVAALDGSGRSVSAAGDVNGDGVDDVIIGASGANPNGSGSGASYVVFGEGGPSDTVTCHGLTATIVGTHAGETLTGTQGRDVIHGRGGDDTIIGGGGNDVLCGGKGDDVLRGKRGNDRLFGGRGTDRLIGGRGIDRCDGGPPTGGDTASGCESVRGVP